MATMKMNDCIQGSPFMATMVTAVTARSGFSVCLNTGSSDAIDVTMPGARLLQQAQTFAGAGHGVVENCPMQMDEQLDCLHRRQ
jgi:hypothetical protein